MVVSVGICLWVVRLGLSCLGLVVWFERSMVLAICFWLRCFGLVVGNIVVVMTFRVCLVGGCGGV